MRHASPVAGLGEIALRVDDLDEMTGFYDDVVDLVLLRRFDDATFFDIAPGVGGHTQVLALFDRSVRDPSGPVAGQSTLDHLAFGVHLQDLASERERLEALGVDVETSTHGWVQWRSLYFHDPEGNEVEFVAFDDAVDQE